MYLRTSLRNRILSKLLKSFYLPQWIHHAEFCNNFVIILLHLYVSLNSIFSFVPLWILYKQYPIACILLPLAFWLNIMFVRLIHIDTFCFSLLIFSTPFYVITTNYLSFMMSDTWILGIFCCYKQCCYEHSCAHLWNVHFSKMYMETHIQQECNCWALRYFHLYKITVHYFPKWLY